MSISPVTSEALQLKLRQLLPSQQGFGTDLSAQDTIVPIIDLTAAAEGSDVPEYLQRALAFGSQTAHSVAGATTTLINTPGFWAVYGLACINDADTSPTSVNFSVTDGATTKKIWELSTIGSAANNVIGNSQVDFTIYLGAGDSLSCGATTYGLFTGTSRQVATNNGTLVNPSGFTPQ